MTYFLEVYGKYMRSVWVGPEGGDRGNYERDQVDFCKALTQN